MTRSIQMAVQCKCSFSVSFSCFHTHLTKLNFITCDCVSVSLTMTYPLCILSNECCLTCRGVHGPGSLSTDQAQPALGRASSFDYSIRARTQLVNLGPFNLWAGLEFSCREPESRPCLNIIMVLAKIVM